MKYLSITLVFFLFFCLQSGCAHSNQSLKLSSQAQTRPATPSFGITLNIRSLFEHQEFEKLNKLLAQYQINSEADVLNERDLFTAYRTFESSNPAHEKLFKAWIKQTPSHYQPYLARAVFYSRLGWEARGYNWRSETKDKQIQKMQQYFRKSIQDISSTLKIYEKSMVSYKILLGIYINFGQKEKTAMIVEKALSISPASYMVRAYYMSNLLPRWGGSRDEMQQFALESQAYLKLNPKLKWLKANVYLDEANIARKIKQYNQAEKLYNKAVEFGENSDVYYERGRNFYWMGDYDKAFSNFNKAIELYTEMPAYYAWRARVNTRLQRYEQAINDAEFAEKLKPFDLNTLKMKIWVSKSLVYEGHKLGKAEHPEEQIEKYTQALRLQPHHAETYYWRSKVYIAQSRYDEALKDLKTSIDIDPNDIYCYMSIDYILARKKEWSSIIQYWDQYIALHPKSGSAYLERGGAYYNKGDIEASIRDAKKSADLGNVQGKKVYAKYRHRLDSAHE